MNQRSIKVNTAWFIAVLPVLFFIVNIYRMRGGSAVIYIAALAAAAAPGIPALILKRDRLMPFILFSAVYAVTLLLNMLLIGNMDAGSFVTSLLLLGLTAAMFTYGWTRFQGAAGFFISTGIIVLALMRRSSTRIFGSSNNYISVILLLAAMLYYFPLAAERRKLRLVDVIPAALCFLVSIWAGSRGGILSTAVLLALIPLAWLRQFIAGKPRRFALLWIAVPVALFVLLMQISDLSRWFMSLGKFDSRGAYSGDRLEIWGAYLKTASGDPLYFLLGAPLADIPEITVLGDNCHNSFLQLHAFNGIIPTVLFLALLAAAVVRYLKERNYLMLALTVTIVIRGMTDKFIFSQYGMPFMLYLVFFPFIRPAPGPGQNLPEPMIPAKERRTEKCTKNPL